MDVIWALEGDYTRGSGVKQKKVTTYLSCLENFEFVIAAVDEVMITDNAESKRIVFDCEGVDLGRNGSVELISICFSSKKVFLVEQQQQILYS